MSLLDWASKKVQDYSGETDRRENVQKLKTIQNEIITVVKTTIQRLNTIVEQFNASVARLNIVRKNKTYPQIKQLQTNLNLFGNLKPIDDYVDEDIRIEDFSIPQRKLTDMQEYVNQMDWDKKQIFNESFKNGVIGTKKKTQHLNLELNAQIDQLNLYKAQIEAEFELKENKTKLEISVAESYIRIITMITNEISSRILPELSIINSFMIAKHIADYSEDLNEAAENEVLFSAELLKNTQYEKYYQFIKNSFAFYIMAVKISTTKVLTNLLNDTVTENDAQELADADVALSRQRNILSEYQVGVAQ
ncbi:MAG TPA: hypothetical protein DEP42_07200 [Ruminococcaceae bacterium]|nr:hypothetical protein [Oscillospiraceae bacterium]